MISSNEITCPVCEISLDPIEVMKDPKWDEELFVWHDVSCPNCSSEFKVQMCYKQIEIIRFFDTIKKE